MRGYLQILTIYFFRYSLYISADAHYIFLQILTIYFCRYSYDLAEQYFKNTHNYLAPDSAFAVGSIRMNIVPVYDIVWLKRDDWESQNDKMPTFPPELKVQVKLSNL